MTISAAFIYQLRCTVWNRLRLWLRLMKQPRYFLGTVVALAYFFFVFVRSFLGDFLETRQFDYDISLALGSCVAFFFLLFAWAWPSSTAGLSFTESEIQILFPAPLTRLQLIQYRLLRAQPAILFTAVLTWLFSSRVFNFAGVWMSLIVLDVYLLVAGLGRARLRQVSVGFPARAVIVLLIATVFIALVQIEVRRAYQISIGELFEREDLPVFFSRLFSASHLAAFLWIPSLFVRPLIATDTGQIAVSLASLAGVGAVLLLLARWLDVSFEDASVARAQRVAERIEQRKQAKHGVVAVHKRMPQPFRLQATGAPEVAFVWKSLISVARFSIAPVALTLLAIILMVSIISAVMQWQLALATGVTICAFLGAFTVVVGPMMVRADLRGDADKLDILKSFPLDGRRLVAGEIAGCFIAVAMMQLLYLVTALSFALPLLGYENWLPMAAWVPTGVLLGGALTLIQVLVQNITLLLFPSWMAQSETGKGGVEKAGSNLILLLVHVLILVLAAIPAGLVFVVFYWVEALLLDFGPAATAFLASIPAVMMLLGEFWLGLGYLGDRFEQLDIAQEFIPTHA